VTAERLCTFEEHVLTTLQTVDFLKKRHNWIHSINSEEGIGPKELGNLMRDLISGIQYVI